MTKYPFSYLSHKRHALAYDLNERIEAALKVKLNSEAVGGENYQLMNYGIGQ